MKTPLVGSVQAKSTYWGVIWSVYIGDAGMLGLVVYLQAQAKGVESCSPLYQLSPYTLRHTITSEPLIARLYDTYHINATGRHADHASANHIDFS